MAAGVSGARRTWRYVTFDATGTLLRPAELPGATYLRLWLAASGQSFSSSWQTAASAALTAQFPIEFSHLSRVRPNFGADGTNASAFPWWRELVLNTMKRAEVADCLAHNEEQGERFTRAVYDHFAQPEAWTAFEDTRPTLEKLQQKGVPMGVISNFDERLEPILKGLGLRDHFQVVTASFNEPHAKPHASIFHSTFKQLQREEGEVDPSRFLHVGDHLKEDFRAAKALGAQARLVCRGNSQRPSDDVQDGEVIATLREL